MNDRSESDELVRDVLESLAAQVAIAPDAYHQVRSEWVRRQRRRKRLGILLAIMLVVMADILGVWALNRSDNGDSIIFDNGSPTEPQDAPVPELGQP